MGGLARRAGLINKIEGRFPEVPVLKLDSGNFRDAPTPAGDTRTDALLRAMQILGYRVVNVGERDVRKGWEEFQRLTAERSLRFTSANIVREDSGEPVFEPRVVVDAISPDGETKRSVGVIGVLRSNPLFRRPGPEGSLLVTADPVERVRAEVAELQAQEVDTIVLLAALHIVQARKIVDQVEGIDLVLGSFSDFVTRRPEQRGDTWIVYGGNYGTHVIETRIFLDGRQEDRVRVHSLTKGYPHDLAMHEFVGSIYDTAEPEETGPDCDDDLPVDGPRS